MDISIDKFEGIECPVWMREMLIEMVKKANQITCMKDPSYFFRKVFGYYRMLKIRYKSTEKFDPNLPKFLTFAECRIINKMYNSICKRFIESGVLTEMNNIININDITSNDILSIQCPTLFAGYHFLFAIVNSSGDKVDIYQSYGNKPLYFIRLELPIFKQYLNNLKNIKNEPKEQALDHMKEIEINLYGNNVDELIDNQIKSYEDQDDITSKEIMEDYFDRFILNNEDAFKIDMYKFNHSDCKQEQVAGKMKKNKTKKRKRKYKRRNTKRRN